MFAKRATKTITVHSSDLGEVGVVIRKVPGRILEDAKDRRQVSVGQQIKSYGPEALRAMFTSETTATDRKPGDPMAEKDRRAAMIQRYVMHDRHTLLHAGIVSWSVEREFPLNIANINDLEEKPAQEIFEAIVDFTYGPIDPAEAAAAPKED